MTWFKRFLKYVATWRKHRAIIKELNAMSDRELFDIGITRDMISELIWLEEDKQKQGPKE